MVATLLDSLNSVQDASISDRIFIISTLFFSTRSCHRLEKKLVVFQTRGKKFSSGVWKSKVRMLEGLIVGMNFLIPFTRHSPIPWFPGQLKKVWRSVSTSLILHLVQRGDWFGRILDVRSAVGRIWWRSLKRKLVRWGPSICCLDRCQVQTQVTKGADLSTLKGFQFCLSNSSVMVISSIKNL